VAAVRRIFRQPPDPRGSGLVRPDRATARKSPGVASYPKSGVRTLVLTHFSQRYHDPALFLAEAREQFDGEIVLAEDLLRVPVPARISSGDDRKLTSRS